MKRTRMARAGLAVVLIACLAAGTALLTHSTTGARIHVVGYFANSNGLFVGDEVRILGVPVGTIDSIEPQPQRVKIRFSYDAKYSVPANATAAILSPALVTSRAIQLTPAYTGGATLQNNAVIPQERTAVPVEWDDFRHQLQRITDALQPTQPGGVSSLGAVINTAADNLRGQGANIHKTVRELSAAVRTIGDHSGDLFATVRSLSALVSALHNSTELTTQLNHNFAAVTAMLANNSDEIGTAIRDLRMAADHVKTFVADNREALGTASDKLASVTTSLVESIDDVKQALHVTPTAFQNYINIYEPAHAALVGAPAITNFSNPIQFLCGAIQAASRLGSEQSAKLCVQYLAPIVKNRQYNFLPFGFNFLVGAKARPNEITYSEDWMAPDYVPPPDPAAAGSETAGTASGSPPTTQTDVLAAETPPIMTDPAKGLPGMMVPHGGGQ